MPIIAKQDLEPIAETFNKLIARSDKSRLDFSKTLLTIYTPVTSGFVFLATTFKFADIYQKITFLIALTSGALIVVSALTERYGYSRSSTAVAKSFIDHVNQTGKHTTTPLYCKGWHKKLISYQIFIMSVALLVNILAITVFVYLIVL